MTLKFNISTLASTLAEGGSYSFTLTPKGALVGSVDIRWVIVPKGKVPITNNDFIENDLPAFDGTESFAAGATAAQTVTITPTDDAVAEVSGEFEIQIYQVVSGGNDILIDSQDVVLNDDDDFSSVPVNTLSGNGNVNNFFFGSSNPLDAEGLAGDDVYVISRYQTGAVDLSDGFDNNILKFDYGVEISSARAVSRGSSGELLLGTDASSPTATVTWNAPTGSKWKYQIADGAVLTWSQFLTALGPTTGTALTNAYTVDSLASDSVTGGNVASLFSGSGADEVFSFGGDGVIDAEGLAGDDVYIISRYQTGAVDLSDGFGANILKLDYGVEISSARAVSRGSSGELLLGTDASSPTATVTWNAPTGIKWKYQIADGDVLSWSQFLAALGPTTGTALTNAYTVEDPPGKIITSDATGTALSDNTAVTTNTAVYTATGSTADVAGDTIVWSLKAGDDFGLFNIHSSTGRVTFKAATTPNHESGKTSYSFTIVATVGTGATAETDELLVTIAVTDINDTPPMFTSDTAATLVEGTAFSTTTPVYTATATPDVDGAAIVWSLSGTDSGLFNINTSTGAVTFITATTIDFESGKTSYRFNVIAKVGTGSTAQTATQEVTLSVPNVNDAPIISTNAGAAISLNVLEGTTIQTPIAKIVASDDDGDSLIYSLSGVDAADFSIDANGVIKFVAVPSRATPVDSDTDNVYNVTVTVSDGALSDTIALTINVLTASGATAPTISSGASGITTFAENTEIAANTLVYTATGSAGSVISWSLKGAENDAAASYTTTNTNGTASVTFTAAATGTAGNDLNVAFVNIGGSGTSVNLTYDESTKILTITHGNNAKISDLKTAFNALTGDIPELFTLTTTGNTSTSLFNFSGGALTGGVGDIFKIDPFTGDVTFKIAITPDFEADPSYVFTVVATTGTLSTEQAVTITITDVEDAPVLAGDLSGEVKEAGLIAVVGSEKKVFEAHGIVFTVKDDADEDAIKQLEDDVEYFSFGAVSRPFTEIVATDDSDSNNLWRLNLNSWVGVAKYSFLVNDYFEGLFPDSKFVNSFDFSLADGIDSDTKPPNLFARVPFALATISTGLVPTQSAGDPTATGQLSVTDEDDADGFGAVDLQVRVDSGSAWETATSSGKGLKIDGTYGALYIKSDGSWSYELNNADPDTAALTPDDTVLETFELRVTDGGTAPSEVKILTITVEGTNDSQLSATASGGTTANGVTSISVAEDTQTDNVTTITVTNPDGTPLSYSLLGADRNSFTFDETTGILRFKEIPDFEFPTDAGGDNVYNVTVHIDDGVFSQDIVLEVTVTDVPSTANPTITSGASGSIDENLQYSTTDFIYVAKGDSGSHERIVWSLKPANSDDAALFDINQLTGWVTFKTATTLDYEGSSFIGSTAADGTPEFKFTIVATVGSGSAEKEVSKNIIIKLENLNDAPEITTNSGNAIALSVDENSPSTTILTTIAVDEDDVGTNLRYSLSGADASDFNINAQGELRFNAAPNHEAPVDNNTDNIYKVTITVHDDVDASGSALDSDVRRFSYDGGVATITDSDAVGNTPASRIFNITSGSITKSDGTTHNFAAQTGLNVTADSYIIVDDLNNDNTYEVRLVSKTSGLPSGNDYYVLGEVEPHTVQGASFASVTLADVIVISSTTIGADGNGAVFEVFNNSRFNNTTTISEDPVTGKITISSDAEATLQSLINAINTHALTAGRFTAEAVAGVNVSAKVKDIAGFPTASSSSDLILTGGSNTRDGELTIQPILSDTIDVTVTVTNLYDSAPIISSGDGTAIVENVVVSATTPVYEATGTADVGTTIVWSLKAGDDAGSFGIDSSTGVVTFNSATAPDFESKPNYQFTIIATTGSGATQRTTEKAVTISVIDVNEAPIITDDSGANDGVISVSVLEANSGLATNFHTIVASDDESETISYRLSGADAALFTINASNQLNFKATPDFETPKDADGDNNYEFKVVATDNVYDASGDASDADYRFFKYTGGALSKTDSNGERTINVASGTITKSDGTTINFAAAGLAVTSNAYVVVYNVSGTYVARLLATLPTGGDFYVLGWTEPATISISGGSTRIGDLVTYAPNEGEIDVRVSVTNRHDSAPIITSDDTGSVAENKLFTTSTPVYTATGTPDIASSPITWSLKDGQQANLFNINANTGVVTFKSATTPNYESGGTSYSFTIIATAGGTGQKLSTEKAITINKIDSFDIPFITTNGGVSPYSVSVAENKKIVTSFTATDNESDTLSYRVSGADAALFAIDSSGVLSFKSAPDFETPADVGTNNTYDVTVHAGGGEYDASGNASDADTRIFKYTGGITTVGATGIVSTIGGTITRGDNTTFNFQQAAGVGLAASVPSYIIVSRASSTTPYRVRLVETLPEGDDFYVLGQADAGVARIYDPLSATIDVEVSVTNVADNAPSFNTSTSNSHASVVSGGKGQLTLKVDDADGASIPLTYSLLGEDRFDFIISHVSNTQAIVTLKVASDKENPTDENGDNSYRAILRVQETGVYDASGDQSDADTRVFNYSGGALSSSNQGFSRKVNVAAGTITEGDTTISFAGVTGLTISGTAHNYIIVDDADDNGTYEARLTEVLPNSDDFYVLGRAEAATIPLTKASGTFGGVVFTAINPGNAGNYVIKFFNTGSVDVTFNGKPGAEIQIDVDQGSTTLQHIINAINNIYSDTHDYVVASLASGANAQSVFSYSSQGATGTLLGDGNMTGGTQRAGDYFVNDIPLHDDIAIQIDVV